MKRVRRKNPKCERCGASIRIGKKCDYCVGLSPAADALLFLRDENVFHRCLDIDVEFVEEKMIQPLMAGTYGKVCSETPGGGHKGLAIAVFHKAAMDIQKAQLEKQKEDSIALTGGL